MTTTKQIRNEFETQRTEPVPTRQYVMFEPLQMMTSAVSNVEKQKTVRNLGRHGFNLLERLKKLVYR